MKVLFLASLGALLAVFAQAQKDPHFVDGRNTIVHLFEWKWDAIASECENFLSKKKYGGVQISPAGENLIVEDPFRPWWERYQPVSHSLNTRSGDEAALADMIKRCNDVGVRIYVDILLNDMAGLSGTGTAGNTADPASKSYPGIPYTNENFHETCDINYSDATSIRNCELSGLKDLDQSQDYVRQQIKDYLNHLISLGVAGFRVDAAKHMWPQDLEAIFSTLDDLNTEHNFAEGSRAFIYQEVVDTGVDAVSNTEYIDFGRVIEFKNGAELSRCFRGSNPLHWLVNWGTGWGLIEGEHSLVMIDNHDTQRNGDVLNYKNPKPYKAAIAFMLAHPYEGITRVMSSFDFNGSDDGPPNNSGDLNSPLNEDGTCASGWVCEHRWREIYNMVEFRSVVAGTNYTKWWDNGDNQIAFSREDKGFVVFTVSGAINEDIPTDLPAGTYCDVVSGEYQDGQCTGKSLAVDASGVARVSVSSNDENFAVAAFQVNARM
ncbi:alpha-amylase-like [Cylas formicarius]|uniref:alpha-amylase-like n=1 Tax=Cylas formicarius TaxID=197179 RepID=UPI002958649C|nr:alpha-amylase-like [Cylas formicarius]